jgi:hypothetical protein
LVATIEPKYIENLRDTNSNSIMIPLHDVLSHLFSKYGIVSAEALAKIDQKVRTMVCNISEPLVTIYNQVEELTRLATAAANPYTIM